MNNQHLINYLHGRGLVGGAGSKEGAKNNDYINFLKANKGMPIADIRALYHEQKRALEPRITETMAQRYNDEDIINSFINNASLPVINNQSMPVIENNNPFTQKYNDQSRVHELLGLTGKQRTKKIRTKKAPNVAEIRALAKASGIKLSHMVAGKRRIYTKGELMAFLNLI